MPIAITEDHRSLGDVARSFATDAKLRAATRALIQDGRVDGLPPSWAKIVELGWTGLHLPEDAGGSGAGLPELAVVVEELGAAVAPGPLLPAVIGSAVIARCGTDDLRAALLPSCADGSLITAFATAPGVTLDGERVSGDVSVVGGVWADQLLLAVGDDLVVVTTDQDANRSDTDGDTVRMTAPDGAADAALGIANVHLQDAPGLVLAGYAGTAVSIARTVAAAEACGGARATLAMALDYAKVREQFGRTIGSFQAVKHHLANMLIAAERATAVAWDAARAAERTDGQAELAGAVAGAVALEAYRHNAQLCIQIHGGIGFTWEHDAHLYLRRAITLAAAYGSPDDTAEDTFRYVAQGVRRTYAVDLPPEAEEHRRTAREFVARYQGTAPDARRALLVESGYLVPHWPAPFGRAAGSVEQLVIEEELATLDDVPTLGIGGWVLLTLVQTATPDQIERWIKPSLEGRWIWCQLFSEPNAGSDAAAVQTRAVRDESHGGGWRITGQKVWTSGAQYCHRGLATVRTDPAAPKHKGITAVVVDLHAPGVEVRPLREISGDALFNEVFFDDVFVPDEDVVGEVNGGWAVARATLGNERVSIGGGRGSLLRTRATDLVARLDPGAGTLRREVGALVAAEQVLALINLRSVARSLAGREPGAEGSVTKVLLAEHGQAITELALRIAGMSGVDGGQPAVLQEYLLNRAMTIAGGTSEVSRNVIAERLLGLPRELVKN